MSTQQIPGNLLLNWTQVIGSAVPIPSTPQSPTSLGGVSWAVDFIRAATTAFTNAPYILFQGSKATSPSGSGDWVNLDIWQPQIGASVAGPTLNGGVSGGATSLVVSSAAGLALQNVVGIIDGASLTQSEIFIIGGLSGTTVNSWTEGLANAHLTGCQMYNQAEMYEGETSFNYNSYRVVPDCCNSAVGFYLRARMIYTKVN